MYIYSMTFRNTLVKLNVKLLNTIYGKEEFVSLDSADAFTPPVKGGGSSAGGSYRK